MIDHFLAANPKSDEPLTAERLERLMDETAYVSKLSVPGGWKVKDFTAKNLDATPMVLVKMTLIHTGGCGREVQLWQFPANTHRMNRNIRESTTRHDCGSAPD